ncbi:hypothetical protein GCK72_001470 [Caenorhabditis remanei]|uniref:Aminopeptidase n=1 Tax=Caenorhabditis remanei TaxID=31234 RepID=A0A6A5HTU6_CAERE|nr:hypothetical protein GCK72_001470 [Caenorhabditis remanei]KAF1769653.1 hypothetical protein GCK72_001470 [Caenorhabditis remanei]
MQASPPPPPTSSAAKMLYEEGETHDGLTIWTPSNPYRVRSSHRRARICVAITFGILMFGLGFSAGGFLHAIVFPDGSSSIIKIPSFLKSSDSFEMDNSTLIRLSDVGNSVELEDTTIVSEEREEEEDEDDEKGKKVNSNSSEDEKDSDSDSNGEKENEEDENEENEEEDEEKKKVKIEEESNKKKRRGKKEPKVNSDKSEHEENEVEESEKEEEKEDENEEESEKKEKEEEKVEEEEESGDKFVKANKECTNITWYSSRLPRTAEPIEYELILHPNLTNGEVEAEVTIRILIKSETKLLILNAENLEMVSYEISKKGSKLKADFIKCEVMTQWAWKFGKRLHKGDHIKLKIKYTSQMKSDLQGLYFSTHLGTDGKKTKSAATQFEPTFARKMLPCFDEPNFKATFQVSIIRNANHIARSNMNLLMSKEYKDGLIKDEFEKSVKMSTYLLAVAVLDGYGYIRRLTRNTTTPIEVRLYAPEDMLVGQAEFGLDTTIRALEFFEHYFNISYPLDKIDLLALDDFSEGAMENWGLVTFRDSALLFNERKASVVAKEHIALIICHEIAHQWFGNLVTMDWWNEVFLNEGFANYMEYKCVDELFPDWSIMSRFYAENLAFSQEPDGFLSSRAIESDDDDSLLNLFDAINYHKAAAIIHMIAEMAGQKNFQSALIEYLNKYAYDNAIGVDLWKIVEKHANLQGTVSIPDLAKAYTTQVGYPLITVERVEDVTWETTSNDWLLLNTGGVGYFKVLYDSETYGKLIKELKNNHSAISPIDRSMIIVDSYDLSKTSLLNISVYMDLLEYVEKETDKMTWSIVSKQLRTIESLIEDSDYLDIFQDFQRSIIMKLYESLDWDEQGATPNQKRLQVDIFAVACRLRIKDCTKQAYQRYLKWVSSGVRNPEHHMIALMEGVKQGGTTAWERIWKAYKTAVSPSEKNNIIGALTSTKDVTLINRILKYCLDGKIKANLIPRVFSYFALNQHTRNTVWKYFKSHFNEFHVILGKGSLMASCVKCLAEPLSTENELEELQEFLKSQKFEEDGQIKMEMTYEQIELNIQWRKLNEAQLGKWISKWDERRRTLYRRKRHRHNSRHLVSAF